MPTDRQIARLYSLARACGLTRDEVKQELLATYRVASSKDLSPYQYEAYTARLQRAVDAAAKGRSLPPEAAQPRPGQYTSAEHLGEFAGALQTFGKAWAGEMTDDDRALLVIVLDKFRLFRTRDRSLSQKQLDEFIAKVAQYPLPLVREACCEYLAKHTTKNEKYFLGIVKGMKKNEDRRKAARQGDLIFA